MPAYGKIKLHLYEKELHILVSVPFRRVGQADIAIEFVVDTGFTGYNHDAIQEL